MDYLELEDVVDKMCKAGGRLLGNNLQGRLNWKIKDGSLRFKGGFSLPAEHLTQFLVKGAVGCPREEFDIIPCWYSKETLDGYREVNLLPFIAVGLPKMFMLNHDLLYGELGESEDKWANGGLFMDVSIDTAGSGDKRTPDYAGFIKAKNMCKRMLVQVPELGNNGVQGFGTDVVLAILEWGWWGVAEILLKNVNNNPCIASAWCSLGTLYESEYQTNLNTVFECKPKGRGKIHKISNSEKLSLTISSLWLLALYLKLGSLDKNNIEEASAILESLKKHIFNSIGTDTLAELILGFEAEQRFVDLEGQSTPVEVKYNDFIFRTIYKSNACKNWLNELPYISMYNLCALDCGFRMMYNYHALYSGFEKSNKENEALSLKLSTSESSRLKLERDFEKQRKEIIDSDNDKDKRIKDLEWQLNNAKQRIETIQDELSIYKDAYECFYGDDVSDVDDSSRSLEECIANINEYPLLIVGGSPQFMEKLSAYGLTNIGQQDSPSGDAGHYCFFCVIAKFVSHKVVYYVKSRYNTKDVLFYFNGTNAEAFIRSADDFINKFFS